MRELLWCLICNTIKCMHVHSHKQTKTNSASQWGGLLKTFLRTLKTLGTGFIVISWGFKRGASFGCNICLQLHPCESKDVWACGVFGEQKRVSDPLMPVWTLHYKPRSAVVYLKMLLSNTNIFNTQTHSDLWQGDIEM